jgi:hypothetical protein
MASLVFAGRGGVKGVVLVCPLQRDGWGNWGCIEFRGLEDFDVELFFESPDAADDIGVTIDRTKSPSVYNVDHAHTFKEEEGHIPLALS